MSKLTTATLALCVLALAGCTATSPEPEPAPTTSETEPPAPQESVEEPPALELPTRTVSVAGGEADLTVGPLALDGDLALLRLEIAARDTQIEERFDNPYVRAYGPSGVQLLDADNGYVHDFGWSDDGNALTELPGGTEPGETSELFLAYAAPRTDTPVVIVPHAGFFTPPVIDAADAEDFPSVAELAGVPETELTFPVSELESYSEELGGALSTRETDAATLLTMSADVLFDKDSAELSSAADAALERAASRISGDGELTIVGHTDDVGSREHNQKLSEDRAASVADALGDLMDLSAFDVVVEGRAFDEPAVAEQTEEARAENRRVEIHFAAAALPSEQAGEQELPEASGPTGTGPEGITLEQRVPFSEEVDQRYDVKLERVQKVGGYLTGEIELTNLDEEPHDFITVFSAGIKGSRGELSLSDQNSTTRLTLAHGDALHYPLDYATPDRNYVMRGGERKSMGQAVRGLDPGESTIVTVVWPEVPGELVTLDSPWLPVFPTRPEEENRGGPPFRLTDIPVEDLSS